MNLKTRAIKKKSPIVSVPLSPELRSKVIKDAKMRAIGVGTRIRQIIKEYYDITEGELSEEETT